MRTRNPLGCSIIPNWETLEIISVPINRVWIRQIAPIYTMECYFLAKNRAILCVKMWMPLHPGIHTSAPP